jgi:hypothetical protein
MTCARSILLCLALVSLVAGCRDRRAEPEWLRSAPGSAPAAISCPVGWTMDRTHLRAALGHHPEAARALERFLERTRIDPRDPGRVTFYLARPEGPASASTPPEAAGAGRAPDLVVMLSDFANPGQLQAAIADAFPLAAGEITDPPHYSVLDLPPFRFRALVDREGRIWLGDLDALTRMGSIRPRYRGELAAALARIGPAAWFQGFILPEPLLTDTTAGLPGELARSLPHGVAALAWGLTPGPDPAAPNHFELTLTGPRGAIQHSAGWFERLLAAAAAMPGTPAPSADLLQENHRLGMRCQLSQEQTDLMLLKLGLPVLPCH